MTGSARMTWCRPTLIKLYVRWSRVRAADHPDAYARTVLVREFIQERRSLWVKRVSLVGRVSDSPAAAVDHDVGAARSVRGITPVPVSLPATLVATPHRQGVTGHD